MEIYLNGELAEPEVASRVVLTRQANDITKPDKIQVDYSNAVSFSKTKANRERFGFAEEVDSDTLVPYRYQEAQLLSNGIEILPYGKFELKESKEAYEGTLFSGNIRFFDVLGNKKLRDLDLSGAAHAWNRSNIIANLDNTEGFFYAPVAIGKEFTPNNIPVSDLYPHVYAKSLWILIFMEAGFIYDMEEPGMFAREFLPTSEIPKYSKEFTQARSYYGYVPVESIDSGGQSQQRNTIERPIPFVNTDGLPFFNGASGNFNQGALVYTADKALYVSVAATTYVSLIVSQGTVSARLSILHNGVEVGYQYLRSTDVEGPLNEMNLSVNVEDILLQPDDTLETKVKLQGETTLHRWGYQLYHYGAVNGVLTEAQKTGASLQITVKDTFPEGGGIDLINWLPDMSQKDFVKAMVKLHGWTMQTDPYENRIKLTLFNSVLQNRNIAKDWTLKRDFSEREDVAYTFGDFARRNLFAWKEDDRTQAGYGDGVLLVDNETLPAEFEALKMPFAATGTHQGFPNVEVWQLKEGGDFSQLKIEPRILLRSDKKITFGITEDDNTEVGEGWKTYFADATEAFDLDMQRTIIPRFYDTLLSVLNKCKHVQAYYRLTAQDISEFDQSVPIFDANFGQYFYLNQIEQYEDGKSTLVHLYRLGEPAIQTITE